MSNWLKFSERVPRENEAVFWKDANGNIWLGDYSDDPEAGLVSTVSYENPYFSRLLGMWVCDSAEWDDHQPTHWHPLPELEKESEVNR